MSDEARGPAPDESASRLVLKDYVHDGMYENHIALNHHGVECRVLDIVGLNSVPSVVFPASAPSFKWCFVFGVDAEG